jgi:hypothetical protein
MVWAISYTSFEEAMKALIVYRGMVYMASGPRKWGVLFSRDWIHNQVDAAFRLLPAPSFRWAWEVPVPRELTRPRVR